MTQTLAACWPISVVVPHSRSPAHVLVHMPLGSFRSQRKPSAMSQSASDLQPPPILRGAVPPSGVPEDPAAPEPAAPASPVEPALPLPAFPVLLDPPLPVAEPAAPVVSGP